MGTDRAPLGADVFSFCYECAFMMSLSDNKHADIIDAFSTTCRYFDDILSINNIFLIIYPLERHLNKANTFDTKASFWDLQFAISMILFLPK